MHFLYSSEATNYLKERDPILGAYIDKIGYVYREVDEDIFAGIIHQIIGQQISMKAQETIFRRFQERFGVIDLEHLRGVEPLELQRVGISSRKASYIKDFINKVEIGELDLEALKFKSDEEVIEALTALKGIGVWTAEMLLLFTFQRMDIFSYGDLAILKGLKILHHHRKITPRLFNKYKRLYSPYCSVASLYLWVIAGGTFNK